MDEGRKLEVLNISDILPNRFQPRIRFEDDSLERLAASISKYGVIEPIIVRPIGNKYEIIAGERRYKASKLVGKSTIPSIIINLSDKDSEEIALLENVQRRSLNPIEEAVSYKKIINAGHISREDLSLKIGKSQSEIQNKIRLLNLSDEVQSYLLNNKISEAHARSLLRLDNIEEQNSMLHRIVKERLTVKSTDREIKKIIENNNSSDDEIEELFVHEKGDKKMDIDRIMKEAKDINVEEPVKETAPDLMSSGNDVTSELITREDVSTPIVGGEPSKFFSVSSQPASNVNSILENVDNSSKTVNQDSSNNVTFDSMFKSSILESQNNDSSQGISGIVADAMKKYNSGINSSSETTSSPATPAPEIASAPVTPAPEIASAPATPAPEIASAPVTPAPEIASAPATPAPEITSAPATPAPEIASAPTTPTPEVASAPATPAPEIAPAPTTPAPEISSAPVTPAPEVASSPVTPAPEISSAPVTPAPEISSAPVTPAPEIAPAPATPTSVSNVVPDPFTLASDVLPKPDIISETTDNNQTSVVLPSSLEEKTFDFPDDSIIDTSDEKSKTPAINNSERKITESPNIPSFAKIIKKLRDCADEIEKNGYLINVDEMDMDKQYKVIFTIDKE